MDVQAGLTRSFNTNKKIHAVRSMYQRIIAKERDRMNDTKYNRQYLFHRGSDNCESFSQIMK
jgi:hypothetical protein